jgi:hypothetical protein
MKGDTRILGSYPKKVDPVPFINILKVARRQVPQFLCIAQIVLGREAPEVVAE